MFKLVLINQPDVIMYIAMGTVSLSISIRLARSCRARRQETGAVISVTEARPTEARLPFLGRYSLNGTWGTKSILWENSYPPSLAVHHLSLFSPPLCSYFLLLTMLCFYFF
jgi:hypothetical protein